MKCYLILEVMTAATISCEKTNGLLLNWRKYFLNVHLFATQYSFYSHQGRHFFLKRLVLKLA